MHKNYQGLRNGKLATIILDSDMQDTEWPSNWAKGLCQGGQEWPKGKNILYPADRYISNNETPIIQSKNAQRLQLYFKS